MKFSKYSDLSTASFNTIQRSWQISQRFIMDCWERYLYLLRTFCPHLGSFCVVSSFTTFRPNFTSGLLQVILPRPRIGMLSLVTEVQKFGTDPTMEDQIRIYKTKKSILDRPSWPVVQRIGVESLRFQVSFVRR